METINKSYMYRDNYFLNIRMESDKFDNDVEKKLDNIFSDENINVNTLKITYILNALTKDIPKVHKTITIVKDEQILALINFNNNKLVNYYSETNINGKSALKCKYSNKSGLNFRVEDAKYAKMGIINKLDEIEKLDNMNILPLGNIEIAIKDSYELFYRQIPDFTIKNDRDKARYMLAILDSFNIRFDNLSQIYYNDGRIITDYNTNLFNLAVTPLKEERKVLSDDQIEKIAYLGLNLKSYNMDELVKMMYFDKENQKENEYIRSLKQKLNKPINL